MSQRYEFFEWELAGGTRRMLFRAHIAHVIDTPTSTFAHLSSGMSVEVRDARIREWLVMERPS